MQPAIPYLRTGDRVALAAPARAVSPEEMAPAIGALQSWGLEVVVPDGLYERQNQLAGSDGHRAALLQGLLDDPSIKAILCARGGYGTVRIVDRLDFTRFAAAPKWIVGYSDATVLHSHVQAALGLPTLHATMPINFPADGSPCPATESLRRALFGEPQDIVWEHRPLDRKGTAEGVVVGGNISILYSLLGSHSQIDTRGKILLLQSSLYSCFRVKFLNGWQIPQFHSRISFGECPVNPLFHTVFHVLSMLSVMGHLHEFLMFF